MNHCLHKTQRFIKRNSSTILTIVGAAGVVGTAVMAVKATPKALQMLDEAKEEKGEELTKFEAVQVAGPAYIPSVVMGAATIACIFGANALNKRQQAALMSAYALLDNSYKDYKKKVEELYGEGADVRVKQEIAKDKYEDGIESEDDKLLFYDYFSERYFNATMADVLRAEMQVNRKITTYGGAFLNEFYEALDIPPVDYGDYIGWGQDDMWMTAWDAWLDFSHHKTELDDGMECYIITMSYEPVPNFDDY